MLPRVPLGLLAAALALAACGGAPASVPSRTSQPTVVATPTPERPALSLEPLEVEPMERQDETVAVAFDREAAAELLREVPSGVDFDTHAVVCVFLGPRQTTGWSLDLRTASLTGGELLIRARESAPRTATRPQVTYPADCGLLTRAPLPPGELRVWAEDTVTDEFIADTTVEVPEPAPSP